MNTLNTALSIFPSRTTAFKILAPMIFVFAMFYNVPAHAFAGCITIFGQSICANSCQISDTIGFSIGGPADSLGQMICRFIEQSAKVPTLLAAMSYLFGLVLVVFGILKTREHVEMPQQVQIWEPIKRFFAGGLFLALPMVLESVVNTVTGGSSSGVNSIPITAGTPSGGGLDAILFFLVLDVFKPILGLLSAFGYVAGIILVMIGIGRMLKSSQEGVKGPGGIGTIFTFLIAGMLISVDTIMRAVSGSLFETSIFGILGGGHVANFGLLSVGTGSAAVDAHILSVISSVTGFMIIVGAISFIRGIFILRDVAEGNGQASLMAASTHIIGGALAVNIGSVMNAVQSTFGLNIVSFI